MDRTFIFIDECGKADYTDASKIFAIVGVVIDQETRIKLTEKFKKLKLKFFKKESFVFHRTELRNDLKVQGKDIQEFANELRKVLFEISFFIKKLACVPRAHLPVLVVLVYQSILFMSTYSLIIYLGVLTFSKDCDMSVKIAR